MSVIIDNLDHLSATTALPALETERSLTPTEETTNTVAKEILHKDPTLATIQLGTRFERLSTAKLENMEAKANQTMESIDHLLDLSQELTSVNDAQPALTEKALAALQKLREKGISLIDERSTVTKEQLITLKSNISLRIDKLRTESQQTFTKIQTMIQYMSSVNDTVKKMISEHSDFMRKIVDRFRKG